MSTLTRTAATMDEEFSAPVDLLPPAWMKHCTIAPAQQMPGLGVVFGTYWGDGTLWLIYVDILLIIVVCYLYIIQISYSNNIVTIMIMIMVNVYIFGNHQIEL